MPFTVFTTFPLRSRNVASIGNRMKNVWMQLHFVISIPLPDARPVRPISPRIRSNALSATSASTPLTVSCRIGLRNGSI